MAILPNILVNIFDIVDFQYYKLLADTDTDSEN